MFGVCKMFGVWNQKKHYSIKEYGQFSGLPSVVPFVPLGCFSRSFLPPLRSPHRKKEQQEVPKKGTPCCSFFVAPVFTRSLPFVRRGYCICKATSFRFSSFSSLCIYRPLHFGGCSTASHHLKRYASQLIGLLHFVTPSSVPFHAGIPSVRRSSSLPGLPWLGDAATPPVVPRSFLTAVLRGVWFKDVHS
jgi:hypothetical protein